MINKNNKIKVKTTLQKRVVPELRKRGFKGSFPHFRRVNGDSIELITFQFNKWGTGDFVIEIAKCHNDVLKTSWGEFVSPERINAQHLDRRLRLGALNEGSDHWFKYSVFSSNFRRIIKLLDTQALKWWRAG